MKKSFESALLLAELLKDDLSGAARRDQLQSAVEAARALYEGLVIEAHEERNNLITNPPEISSVAEAPIEILEAPATIEIKPEPISAPEPDAAIEAELTEPVISIPEILESVAENHKQISLIDSIEEINRQQRPSHQGAEGVHSLADRFHRKPIADIKSAIPIHQKFLFIETLFNRDKAAYEQALDALNKSVSFLEADDYMRNTLKAHYHWEMGNPVTENFIELVERRFL